MFHALELLLDIGLLLDVVVLLADVLAGRSRAGLNGLDCLGFSRLDVGDCCRAGRRLCRQLGCWMFGRFRGGGIAGRRVGSRVGDSRQAGPDGPGSGVRGRGPQLLAKTAGRLAGRKDFRLGRGSRFRMGCLNVMGRGIEGRERGVGRVRRDGRFGRRN